MTKWRINNQQHNFGRGLTGEGSGFRVGGACGTCGTGAGSSSAIFIPNVKSFVTDVIQPAFLSHLYKINLILKNLNKYIFNIF